MIIVPAIDLIDGKPVRLVQGDYAQKEIVAADAREQARKFQDQGAELIHIVDLDGAKAKKPVNDQLIKEITDQLDTAIEVGGGIRSLEDIENYLNAGIKRVILGTRALQDPQFLKETVSKYGDQIVLGLDCRDGFIQTNGWLEKSTMPFETYLELIKDIPLKAIIFTDTATDGMLSGPNLEQLAKLRKAFDGEITASGGIHNLEDLKALEKLGIDQAIIGKALYTGDIDLVEAIDAC